MAEVEDSDSDREVFKRRMGMRLYFKELKMNMERIKKSKRDRDPSKKKQSKEHSPNKKTESMATGKLIGKTSKGPSSKKKGVKRSK